jgi:uncharacterized protein
MIGKRKPAMLKKVLLNLIFLQVFILVGVAQTDIKITGIPYVLSWTNKPLSYHIRTGGILIKAGEKTDMFRDPNVSYNTDNAPRLSFTADKNFVLSVAIHHDFASKWDGGAIVLETDTMNWIKFCFEKDYTGQHRVVSVVTHEISDDCNSAAVNGDQVYYKIAKADNVITLYYSTNGKNWFLIRHLQFNTDKPVRLGFMAQSPTGKSCSVEFSQIKYVSKKITDPYLGE